MKEITLQIPEGKKAEWINGVLTLVDDTPKHITERVKTFQDACIVLGEHHAFVAAFRIAEANGAFGSDAIAYLKLRIIVAALNEGWKPKFTDDEFRWFPYFHGEKQGAYISFLASSADVPSFGYVSVGSRLCLKSKELAEYCGKQFIDIWQDYLLTRND